MTEHSHYSDKRADGKYFGACTCGWTGYTRFTHDAAIWDAACHVEHVSALAENRAERKIPMFPEATR